MGPTIIVAQASAGLTLSAMVWALRAMPADRRRHAAGSGLLLSGEPAIGSFWPGPEIPGCAGKQPFDAIRSRSEAGCWAWRRAFINAAEPIGCLASRPSP